MFCALPSLYHGELIASPSWTIRILLIQIVRVVHPDQMMNFVTKEVVDEVLCLPSEDYNISDFVSGLSMGIDVSVKSQCL